MPAPAGSSFLRRIGRIARISGAGLVLALSPGWASVARADPRPPAKGAAAEKKPPAKAPPVKAPSEEEQLAAQMEKLYAAGRYAEVEPLAEKIIAIDERKLGKDDPKTADATADLAAIENALGKRDRAEQLLLQAIAALEKARGPDHPDVLLRVVDLGQLYKEKGDTARAEPLMRRAVSGYEKAFGPNHLRVADAVYGLAQVLRIAGRFGEAEPLYLRSLSIREALAGPEAVETAKSLNDLANVYADRGEFSRALALHERAIAIAEKKRGPDSPELASYLHAEALTLKLQGDFAKAEALYLRAIAIREKASGPESAALIAPLQTLASLYKAKGDYVRAEPIYQRALALSEKVNGPEAPTTAAVLSSFGLLYRAMRDYARAEPMYERALAIREKTRGPEHVETGDSVNNLGLLRAAMGDRDGAEPLLRRALAIYEKSLGPGHPKVATALANLAGIARDRGDFSGARGLYQRSISITEAALGNDHLTLGTALNNLAILDAAEGDFAEAERVLRRALAIDEAAYGPEHPEVAMVLDNLATVHMLAGDPAGALPLLARSTAMQDRLASIVLGAGSEEQKRAFMAGLADETSEAVALSTRASAADPEATRLALRTVLRRKGRALDAMADSIAALRRRLDAEDARALDDLSTVRSSLAGLLLRSGAARDARAQAEITALDEKRQAIEAQISRRSASFRAETPLLTVEQIEASLPDGAALIEIAAYRPLVGEARSLARFGPARYGAWAVRRGAKLGFVDLGEAAPLDRDVEELRHALSDPARAFAPLARALHARVAAPLLALAGGSRKLYLSPDGGLNLLPFGALLDEHDRYLIEQVDLSYLTSGRDLLRRGDPPLQAGTPVVVANPDFGKKVDPGPLSPSRGLLRGVFFPPLPGTKGEAAAIGAAIGASVLEGAGATEAAIKRLSRPSIVHLATHGFFLPARLPATASAGTRGLALDDEAAPAPASESPLLRSGLAFAGVNAPPPSSGDDGVLTALEAAGLDLAGTRLVVLSACETALGETHDGDGVYGLRRALVLAGAETQVMSLWKVDDAATRDLMVAYYGALLAGGGRSAALRQVSLGMIAGKARAHPFYWAGFIVSGNDAPLDVAAIGGHVPPVDPGPRGCACATAGRGLPAPSEGSLPVALAASIVALSARRRATAR
ncbi:MAG: tetratricopeptide repeat protein [Byssovorax sp.]